MTGRFSCLKQYLILWLYIGRKGISWTEGPGVIFFNSEPPQRQCDIDLSTKGRVYTACVRLVQPYGSKTRSLGLDDVRILSVFEPLFSLLAEYGGRIFSVFEIFGVMCYIKDQPLGESLDQNTPTECVTM